MKLPDQDADDLSRLLMHLVEYAVEHDAEARRLAEEIDDHGGRQLRERIFGSPDLIEACASDPSADLSDADRVDIRAFRHAVVGQFVIERCLKAGAMFVSEESPSRVFQVAGIDDPVEDIIWPREAPLLVEAVLLPFREWVVHDGTILSYSIYFGSGIRKTYKERYLRAKQNGQIIRGPEADGSWPDLLPPRSKPHLAKEAMAIRDAARAMKGGSPSQRQIFALLRGCADLAVAVASEPDELEELYEQAHRVDRAMRKAWKTLERADPED